MATVDDCLTAFGFLPPLGFGACTETVYEQSPALIPTSFPPLSLQNFFDDLAILKLSFDFAGIVIPICVANVVALTFAFTAIGDGPVGV